jgi:molybdopterin-guanine dinucleotide biosynthesis protein A
MTSAVILAGGSSQRFGRDKAFFEIRGRPMIRIVADTLSVIFDKVIVAGGNAEKLGEQGLICYSDPVSGKGALGGIYNGLVNSESESVFFCGCDMPLVKPEVIRVMLDNAADEEVLMPMIKGRRQPLHAIYKKTMLPAVEQLARSEDLFLPALFEEVDVRLLEEYIFSEIPGYHLSFVNLNNPDAIDQYRPLLERP